MLGGALFRDLHQPSASASTSSTARPATASATRWSTPRPTSRSSRTIASRATRSRRASTSCSRTTSSTRSRSRARTPSTSSRSCRAARSTKSISISPITSRPTTRSRRRRSPSSARPWRKEELVGLARVVLYRRERILMLEPRGKGMMATALRYRYEVRDEEDYFDDIPDLKVPADMLELAVHILKSKKAHFDPDKFEDRYENALDRADQGQAGRQAGAEARRAAAEQRHQPDGRAARSVKAEQGGGESRATRAAARTPQRASARASARTHRARKRASSGELTWRRCRPIAPSAISARPPSRAARRGRKRGLPLRHPEARRDAAALRPAARARRRDEELGGDARPEPRAGREAARRPGRGPSARIRRVRGHDPEGRVRRRHRDDLGPRHLDAGGRSAQGHEEGPSRIRAATARSSTAAGIWCACASGPARGRSPGC